MAVIVVVRVLVWAAAVINMVVVVEVLLSDVLADLEIIVVGVIVIVFKFALSVSYSIEVPSGVVVGLLTDALAGAILGDLSGIDVADVSALEFPVPTPLEEFNR